MRIDPEAMSLLVEARAKLELTEAEEIEFKDLPAGLRKAAKMFMEANRNIEITSVWDGIHGFVVDFQGTSPGGGVRFDAPDLKKALTAKVRWVEASPHGGFAVGLKR